MDLTVAEPSYRTITPEFDVDADRARAFLRVQDRNLLGTGCEGEVEASCTRLCINQPLSRVHVDGVEVDATIQLECAVKF